MAREKRRLAAIVSADVVGYSRLMGVDESGTLAALRNHRAAQIDPAIEEHGGRIVKTMGDGLLLEFPSVVDAVQCSIAVQEAMVSRNSDVPEDKRIELRIGINLGDIIIDGEDIQGDGINIAARLEGLAEPGGIVLSQRVHEDVRDRLEVSFVDGGEQELKNIARPIQVWRWAPPAIADTSTATSSAAPLALPDKPSIAVLPFDNMSGDPEQEYFSDGLTEDIITELSRFDNLFVIARNTSFAYKNDRIDVKQIAGELGVHFILEGSVRKAGQRVRITAQLIDGQDGSHAWAERYDGALEDVFDLQEQITSQVVGSITPHVTTAELERIGRGERIFDEAHELGWKAMGLMRSAYLGGDPQLLEQAIAMAVEATEMNVNCGVAYQTICFSYCMQSLYRWGDDPFEAAKIAEKWAEKFHYQLPNSYMAYHYLGLARLRQAKYQDANRDFARAHELNRNDTLILQFWSWCEASAGEFESAKKHAHMALRLSPKDAYANVAHLALAMVAFIEKNVIEFEDWAGKAIQSQPHAPIRRAMMIAYAAEAENQALLDSNLAVLTNSAPNFIASLFRGENQLFQKREHMEMLLSGLRKAGLEPDK